MHAFDCNEMLDEKVGKHIQHQKCLMAIKISSNIINLNEMLDRFRQSQILEKKEKSCWMIVKIMLDEILIAIKHF